jgi:hypothetical protein
MTKNELRACYSTSPWAAPAGKHDTNDARKIETSKNGVIIQSFESEEVEMRLKDDVKALFDKFRGRGLDGNPSSNRQ